ncbi:MAG: DNA-directed RNA polymerase subunit beta' [Candidatus Eisenbacteria bacterium]|nr:DNA-directed RNA polymerase subunit beta' [Candidatus Latescibacterota bacterium]MBD3301594.1 DNA-directed RNA polymerase subunit beta' [Candidatus Eisenbacteria bacterium]
MLESDNKGTPNTPNESSEFSLKLPSLGGQEMPTMSAIRGERDSRRKFTFNSIRIRLASPDTIEEWSYGEVTKPETINYRSFKPEKDGLFCERTFGPVKDWQCSCGRYKMIRYRGMTCDKCGVEVTQANVRRERMGHIRLAVPVSHIWYFKGVPSRIGHLLDMTVRNLERILYYESYVVIDPGNSPYRKHELLSEEQYQELRADGNIKFEADMGAGAIRKLLESLDLDELSADLRTQVRIETSVQRRKDILKRLKIVEAFRQSGNRPEWMILTILPVLPPDLRPLVPLEGGRFATSDLNDLYRRVINRNNRLKKLMEIRAPEVILRNEKRMLQEAVDALFDNGRRTRAVRGQGNRPLKSLSDMLKGKQGRFRQNLLGKRVDYSGRSVIVVGPELKLHECGLPQNMALELFKPFIIRKLEERGQTVKSAKKLVEREKPEVWEILGEIIKDHPVMLNRAPTLHRLGIQAFQPVLVEGKAIRIHPLVCTAFNADFDGDQMAVHVPLSFIAQIETRRLMLSTNNILLPASGRPVATPSQDIVLGCNYLTKPRESKRDAKRAFASTDEVRLAYDHGAIALHAPIRVRVRGELIETTTGRIIFNEVIPNELGFMNKTFDKKALEELVGICFKRFGNQRTAEFLDKLKSLGFIYATQAGITVGIDDLVVPHKKPDIIARANKEVAQINQQHRDMAITENERYNKVIGTWTRVRNEIEEVTIDGLRAVDEGFNPIYLMADSGSRGNKEQIRQLAGMRGLMAKPQKRVTAGAGATIEQPVLSSFREGLTVLEYFISTHGARKGLADTALKTADAGYLTRRLVDVAQDVIISEDDCGTILGVDKGALKDGEEVVEPLVDRVLGRVTAEDVWDRRSGQVLIEEGSLLAQKEADLLDAAGVDQVKIRSVLTCESRRGVCAKCYGSDLSTGALVDIGEAVGVIAAQSIGEPGTQLTLRTFHIGGTASVEVEQSTITAERDGFIDYPTLSVVQRPDGKYVNVGHRGELYLRSRSYSTRVAELDGIVRIPQTLEFEEVEDPETHDSVQRVKEIHDRSGYARLLIVDEKGNELESRELDRGFLLLVQDGDKVSQGKPLYRYRAVIDRYTPRYGTIIYHSTGAEVKTGQVLFEWDTFNEPIVTTETGSVHLVDIKEKVTLRDEIDETSRKRVPVIVEDKEKRLQPAVSIQDSSGNQVVSYPLPTGSMLSVREGQEVQKGEVLAKIRRESSKTRDITGGLPRVSELFEGRKPKDAAVVSEIDGIVRLGKVSRGMKKVRVEAEGDSREYQIPQGRHLYVQEGHEVRAGDRLTEGPVNPHDILKVMGINEVQEYLVDQIQEVYRIQGVRIDDKHIETIVRQMLQKVTIDDPGDTNFLSGEPVDKVVLREELERVKAEGGKPATYQPLLLGITKASLSTRSFVSAASFQETTRILTDASIHGSVDPLRGLKENVAIGHLIPAGTGLPEYRNMRTQPLDLFEEEEEEEQAAAGSDQESIKSA